jgi:hypothetical protein
MCARPKGTWDQGDLGHSLFKNKEVELSSAASPNQVFYNTKVDGEDNGPQREGD